jgi:hypothetical protein
MSIERLSLSCRTIAVALAAPLIFSVSGFAQEASIGGTAADESKAVIPGVSVTATSLETGRQFKDVTSEQGEYRLVGLPAGAYKLQAELPGFATTVLQNVALLVGQHANLELTLKLATVAEEVTVQGEAPIIDTQQSQVAGNIDRRQMQEIPLAGRNWQQLAELAKGITTETANTSRAGNPGTLRDSAFQLSLDGQNITQAAVTFNFGQPGISRDSIAEFQIVTSMFDVTMGRSTGMQVQAITKAGTNNVSGSFYGFFRDDKFNAADAFKKVVLPYSDRQIGGTLGGPIKRDKLHYFASFEGEAEPNTITLLPSALPGQSFLIPTSREVRMGLGRLDYQMTSRDTVAVRYGYWRNLIPHTQLTSHPSNDSSQLFDSNYLTGTWSRIASNNLLHELRLDYFHYHALQQGAVSDTLSKLTPSYAFPGLSLGTPSQNPQEWLENFVTTRYSLSWRKGSHDFKIGAEGRTGNDVGSWLKNSRGQMSFSSLPPDIATRIPASAALDPTKWDLSGLDSRATFFTINYIRDANFKVPRPMVSAWIGDKWKIHRRATLNLGVRYDVAWRDFSPPGVNETTALIDSGIGGVIDVGYSNKIRSLRDIAPRIGFAWTPTQKSDLVIRGGSGLFYGVPNANLPVDQQMWNGQRTIANTYTNDGKPGWVQDPTRGTTRGDVLSGRVPIQPQNVTVDAHDFKMPFTWQNMIGFQKQFSEVLEFDTDLVQYKGYREESQRDPNLFYDPATRLPKNPTVFGRPNPAYGPINLKESHGREDYMALQSSFTRRYRKNFQFGATYTLMFYKRDTGIGSGGYGATQVNTFDIMGDWGPSVEFQRNTVRLNGIWRMPKGFLVSGLFRYGSPATAYQTTTNVDPLALGTNRIRKDLSIIPRNNFRADPFQTLDVRLSKDIAIAERVKLTGIAEVFNIYNYKRYTYNTLETSSLFGQPNGAASQPRSLQLAFRISF